MFSSGQILAIEVIERAMSGVSLFGAFFIIGTFTAFKSLRKPINRLVFYATFGNLLTNLATLISLSGIRAGPGSALCTFQGFFIQMLMPADALWTFCMALNVYLTFFRSYTAKDLRGLEKWYFLACYGIPFLPAIVYAIIQASKQKQIYGNALIWCWVSIDYDWMRIAFFYAPVWLIITVTLTIYIATGREIVIRRAALRELEQHSIEHMFVKDKEQWPSTPSNQNERSFGAVTKVTEIKVTSEPIKLEVFNPLTTTRNEVPEALEPDYDDDGALSFSSQRRLSDAPTPMSKPQYWWSKPTSAPPPDPFTNPIHDHGSSTNFVTNITSDAPNLKRSASMKHLQANASAVSPTSSVEDSSLPSPHFNPDERTSTYSHTSFIRPQTAKSDNARHRLTASQSANRAAISYFKVALLMFVALMVVWVPSTVNRLYTLIQPEKESFVLSFLAAGVLPMQGGWNAAVFIGTSWSEIKRSFMELHNGRQERKGSLVSHMGTGGGG